jgi:hypothetical protein
MKTGDRRCAQTSPAASIYPSNAPNVHRPHALFSTILPEVADRVSKFKHITSCTLYHLKPSPLPPTSHTPPLLATNKLLTLPLEPSPFLADKSHQTTYPQRQPPACTLSGTGIALPGEVLASRLRVSRRDADGSAPIVQNGTNGRTWTLDVDQCWCFPCGEVEFRGVAAGRSNSFFFLEGMCVDGLGEDYWCKRVEVQDEEFELLQME